jgi:drug/metabolite transporter (DMT)-like permease
MKEASGLPPQKVGWGVFWMCVAMLLLVGMDAIAKHLAQLFPVPEVIWARFTFHLLFMAPLLLRRLPLIARTRSPRLQILRGASILLASGCMVTGLRYIPLAETNVLFAASPLIVTALSLPLLKERVGLRQWIGVIVGFAGVMLIVRPGIAAIHPAAAIVLVGAGFYAVSQIAARGLAHFDDPRTTVFYTALICALAMSAIVPFVWVAPRPIDWAVMAAAGFLSLTGHWAATKAFQMAPAAIVSPFNYSGMVWATLFGFLGFGDLPDEWTVIGALLIVVSSLYILRRRRIRHKEK